MVYLNGLGLQVLGANNGEVLLKDVAALGHSPLRKAVQLRMQRLVGGEVRCNMK